MIVRLFCYILAASFVLIDGSIGLGTLRTAYNTKSKAGYFIGFGAILITILIVSVLILIALNLG